MFDALNAVFKSVIYDFIIFVKLQESSNFSDKSYINWLQKNKT